MCIRDRHAGGADDHRDLHYPLRRQRQMCIRDSNRTVAQIETARHKIDITTHFQNLCLSQYFYDVFVEVALCYLWQVYFPEAEKAAWFNKVHLFLFIQFLVELKWNIWNVCSSCSLIYTVSQKTCAIFIIWISTGNIGRFW